MTDDEQKAEVLKRAKFKWQVMWRTDGPEDAEIELFEEKRPASGFAKKLLGDDNVIFVQMRRYTSFDGKGLR